MELNYDSKLSILIFFIQIKENHLKGFEIWFIIESVIQVLKKQVMFMIFAILFVNFLMIIHLTQFSPSWFKTKTKWW